MIRTILILLSFFVTQTCVAAESQVSLEIDATVWAQHYSGDFKIKQIDIRPIDVENDLNYSANSNRSLSISLIHNLPVIPQIKIRDSSVDAAETNVVPNDFTFGGFAFLFSSGDRIQSSIHFDHRDISFYYNIGQSNPRVGVGMTIRKFDGRISIETLDGFLAGNPLESIFREQVPLFYGRLDGTLPAFNLSSSIELHYGRLQGNEMVDLSVMFGYETKFNLGFKLGYRYLKLEIRDFDEISTDIKVAGPQLAVVYQFSKP